MHLEKALSSLRKGKIILVYDSDDRECEADMMFNAKFISPKKIETLRKDAGGLICLAISKKIAKKLGLEFFSDIIANSKSKLKQMDCKKTAYGDKPAFSIAINHKKVYTGITDNDRSLTIKSFSKLLNSKNPKNKFFKSFYTPGHVFLLIGRGIEKRKGHTELSLELAKKANLPEIMVLCEMLGKGKALKKEKVKLYAKKNNLEYLSGREIYEK